MVPVPFQYPFALFRYDNNVLEFLFILSIFLQRETRRDFLPALKSAVARVVGRRHRRRGGQGGSVIVLRSFNALALTQVLEVHG
jgi:hypothetical protein